MPSDIEVRAAIYDYALREGRIPLASDVSAMLEMTTPDVEAAFARLAEAHVLVLQESGEILMANPFSAVPTPFVVEARGRTYWGNCIWDGLGIIAMLGEDGRVVTSCPDCNEAIGVEVQGGELVSPNAGVVHFSVPAARWWDNIRYT
jgi:hypothetical protein